MSYEAKRSMSVNDMCKYTSINDASNMDHNNDNDNDNDNDNYDDDDDDDNVTG